MSKYISKCIRLLQWSCTRTHLPYNVKPGSPKLTASHSEALTLGGRGKAPGWGGLRPGVPRSHQDEFPSILYSLFLILSRVWG